MTPIISKTDMAALLGRSLSTVEDTNYNLYLKIARIRLEDLLCDTMTLPMPEDLQLLLARCFGAISQEQQATAGLGIASKKVEDFSISYDSNANSPMVAFVNQNEALLAKYSQCNGCIRSGDVYANCVHII